MEAVLEQEHRVDEILVGAVDPHVHSGPSIAPRAIDHLELRDSFPTRAFVLRSPRTTTIFRGDDGRDGTQASPGS